MVLFTYSDYLKYKKYLDKSCTMLQETSTPYRIIAKKSKINHVHDKLYRDLLNNKKEFSSFLKYFLDCDIPSHSLVKYNNDFITNDFKNRRSDIIYKIHGQLIYIFLEHQSSVNYSMPYRIFEYYTCLLKDTVDSTKLDTQEYKMPIIIPILLYTRKQHMESSP